MPKFTRRPDSTAERQNDLLARAGVIPMRRSILIDLAEVGVFEQADQLTRSALAEQFGLGLADLDRIVDQLEEIAQETYERRSREPVDAATGESDLEIADEGLESYVERRRFELSGDEAAVGDPERI